MEVLIEAHDSPSQKKGLEGVCTNLHVVSHLHAIFPHCEVKHVWVAFLRTSGLALVPEPQILLFIILSLLEIRARQCLETTSLAEHGRPRVNR